MGGERDADDADGLWGPWMLALGALAIGGAALAVETYRALRDRRRGDPSETE